MKKYIKIVLLVLALTTSAQATLLELGADGFAPFHGITVPKTAIMTNLFKKYDMTTVSYGLRQKRRFLMDWGVYVAVLMVSQPDQFVRTAADVLTSLMTMDAIALRMQFLRDVEILDINTALTEGLFINQIHPNKNTTAFFTAIVQGGDIRDGEVITIAANPKMGSLTYEGPRGTLTTLNLGPDLVRSMLTIWFGVASDANFQKLQTQLLQEAGSQE